MVIVKTSIEWHHNPFYLTRFNNNIFVFQDSVTIKMSDKVYDVGYALTSELQSYLEKLYLQNSRT